MPEHAGVAGADQLTVKLVVLVMAGSGVTLLVGGPVSMVLRKSAVESGALASKTTVACKMIWASRLVRGLG